MSIDFIDADFNPQVDPKAIAQLRTDLDGTAFVKLIPVVERFGFSAEGTLSFLDQIRSGIRNGEMNDTMLITSHELIAAPVNNSTGEYLPKEPIPTLEEEVAARNMVILALLPKEDFRQSQKRIFDPEQMPFPYLSEKPRLIVGHQTNVDDLYLCQIAYEHDGVLWCQERLVYVPSAIIQEVELVTPATATQQELNILSPFEQIPDIRVIKVPPPPPHPELN